MLQQVSVAEEADLSQTRSITTETDLLLTLLNHEPNKTKTGFPQELRVPHVAFVLLTVHKYRSTTVLNLCRLDSNTPTKKPFCMLDVWICRF